MLVLYYGAVAILFICGLAFVVPPLWRLHRYWSCYFAIGFLLSFSYLLYWHSGAPRQMVHYYSQENTQLRNDIKKLRPLHARLQRELVKEALELNFDLNNLDLILHFATLHSQLNNGVLQPEIQRLLLALLKAAPQQVKALNLLAIHAYKTQQFSVAILYWEAILQQFTKEMKNTEVEKILLNKIALAKIQHNEFESRRTK